MISYIKGKLTEILDDIIVVENQGIGYEIHVPLSLLDELPKLGEEVKIFTYFLVREDAMSLYGFFHRQDLSMFQKLLGVTGIGPKGALAMLSALRPDALRVAIFTGDAKALSKAPGVGMKTAQRVILELKDRIDPDEVLIATSNETDSARVDVSDMFSAAREAADALVALGYGAADASRAVRQVEVSSDMTAEDILKKSLRYLL